MIEKCNLCGFRCNVNRKTSKGVCNCDVAPKLALVSKHFWEEPCISGDNGSGTVFFSGCNLSCIFCQNYEISKNHFGKEISIERLSEIFIEQQNRKVHNVNLVSPTPYVPMIIEAIKLARNKGFNLPIVYNTNGFDTVETIKMLDGFVDIYLPDLKYYDDEVAIKYSKAPHYFEIASETIKEMERQVGKPVFDEHGIMKRGLIVRHLVLPGHITQTKKIMEWIKTNLSKDTFVSIMAQYFPAYKAKEDDLINRKLSKKEYDMVIELTQDIENGFIQELRRARRRICPNI